ncbi:MAG: hypothetical protein ABIZ70_11105 [Gemmatimonadales bacterium]
MPTQPERQFSLPPERRAPTWAWGLAIAAHVAFAILWATNPHGYDPQAKSPWREVLDVALSSQARQVTMVYRGTPRRAAPSPSTPVTVRAELPTPTPPPAPLTVPKVSSSSTIPSQLPLAIVPKVDTPPVVRDGRIGPKYGDGRVWVRPLPETPKQIASALTGKTPAQLADSAVAVMVQDYLEAMAKEEAGQRNAPPSWTTKVAGQLVGLDAKWIYLGPLKIPTMLLGLLPINLQGNPTQADFNRKLSVMRQDLFDAARRADNLAEFKKAVKELRQEKQRQKDFEKNQRTAPDTSR